MNLRSSLACTSSDIARWGLRSVLKRQGGVLPGRIAMKIDPELLSDLAGLVDRSVVITGTNGKTTTSNLIADAVAASGATVVCNRAGNNMEPGVVGALLEARSGLKRAGGKRVGVFECDELYTVRVLPKLKPTYFVLLNLFRDQLDRYGEIDHTQEVIAHALELSPATTLIYNADDPLCASIAARVPNASIAFGIDGATNTESDRISDSRFCSQCNAPLEYDYVQYGQLGAYHCPSCGWARPALVRRVTGVELGCDGYGFDLVFGSAPDAAAAHIATRYNGLYMVYNVAAAFFAAHELGVDTALLQPTLDAYVPGGRMGRWDIAGRTVEANLAKNPVASIDRSSPLRRRAADSALSSSTTTTPTATMYRGSTTSTLSASPTRRVLSPLPEARARTTCRYASSTPASMPRLSRTSRRQLAPWQTRPPMTPSTPSPTTRPSRRWSKNSTD